MLDREEPQVYFLLGNASSSQKEEVYLKVTLKATQTLQRENIYSTLIV